MIAKLINTIFNAICVLLNLGLAPINAGVSVLFPDLSQFIATLTSAINLYLGNGLAFFLNLLPPNSRAMILLYLTFLVSFYGISISCHVAIWAFNLIKKLPLA